MNTRTGLAIGLLMVLTALATNAWAQESDSLWNFYVGAGLGITKIDDTACDALEAIGRGTQQNCDDEDTGWKIYGGWQPLRNFAFEAGYVDLGETTAKGGTTNLKAEADGFQVAALAFVPGLEKIGLFIKGGVYFYDAELSGRIDIIGDGTPVPVKADESDSAALYGMGLRLPLTDNLRMSIEFERYLDIGDDSLFSAGETDVNMFSAGAVWAF